MWPFKKKTISESDADALADEIAEKVRSDIQKHGGFAIIGLNVEVEGKDGMVAVAIISNTSKSRVMYTTAKAIQMDPLGALMSMSQYSPSKVSYKSPIQPKDLGR